MGAESISRSSKTFVRVQHDFSFKKGLRYRTMIYRIIACLLVGILFYGLGYFQQSSRDAKNEKNHLQNNNLRNQPLWSPTALLPSNISKNKITTSSNQSSQDQIDLKISTGGSLYRYLFSSEFREHHKLSSQDLHALQERFHQSYPTMTWNHFSPAQQEASDRIGLVKAISLKAQRLEDPSLKIQFRSLIEFIATNPQENILVRRQALRDWGRLHNGMLSSADKWKWQAQQDLQIRALASVSDEDMIEVLLEK